MSYLDRLREIKKAPDTEPTKPTKPTSDGFVGLACPPIPESSRPEAIPGLTPTARVNFANLHEDALVRKPLKVATHST